MASTPTLRVLRRKQSNHTDRWNNTKTCERLSRLPNRGLEPYRGCHSMIRAIPELQRRVPDVKVLIVGKTSGVLWGSVPKWRMEDVF